MMTAAMPGTKAISVRVYHDRYGCESGCCGHVIELKLPDGSGREDFEFAHPYDATTPDEMLAWARECATEVIRKNWPECLEAIDWDTLEVDAHEC